jgi:hypothetical protein
MFLVVNTTKQHLSLGDLKVVLSPSQSIDLDSVADRRVVDASPSVKKAVVAGYLRVVNKDSFVEKRYGGFDMDALREIVRQENGGKAMADLAKSISEIKNLISSIPAAQVVHVSGSHSEAINENISFKEEPQAENLVAIHERVVSRMAQKMSSNIGNSDGVSADAGDMRKKLDELEGLI